MNMAKTGFKITSQPLIPKEPSRNQVNVPTQKFRTDDRNTVQAHIQRDNPKHYYSSALEAETPGSGKYHPDALRRCNPGGPTREIINHAYQPDRPHTHMGTKASKRAHSFAWQTGINRPQGCDKRLYRVISCLALRP